MNRLTVKKLTTNKNMKRCLMPLNLVLLNIVEDMGLQNLLKNGGGNVKWFNHFEEQFGIII